MRTRAYLIIILLASVLLAGLWLTQVEPVEAKAYGGCANTYVVQPRDTLYRIARRFGTTVYTLVQLNGIHNPNLIYVGQVLCLPDETPPTPTPAPTPAPPQVVIEATYIFTPTADETEWPLSAIGQVGKRVVYPLASIDAFQSVTVTRDLLPAISDDDPPILWVAGTRDATPGYMLVSVGEGEPLATLRISDTHVVTPFVPSPDPSAFPTASIDVLGDPGFTAVNLTLWMESGDGVRYPFEIVHIAHAEDVGQIKKYFSNVAYLALLPPVPPDGEGYRVVMVLSHKIAGPPGGGWPRRCTTWRGGGGFYGWMAAWYGCP